MRYIFVHGSWHASWCWKPLADLLIEKGHSVLCVDLPGHGGHTKEPGSVTYDDYYILLENLILQSTQPVVLVAHSMSGILAAPMLDQWSHHISHLYLISAFVVQGGKSLMDVIHSSFNSSNIFSILEVDKARNLHKIDSKKAAEIFYYDCPDEIKAWATTQLQHQPLSPLTTAIDWTDSGSQKENRTYIICEEDKTIPPSVQREMLKNYPCREISLQCGHVPFLSHTEKLAEILGSHWVKKPKNKPKKDESKANSVNLDFLNDYLKY